MDEIRQLKQRVKSLEVKLPRLSVEIAGFDTTRTELTKIIPELKAQCHLSPNEEKELTALNKVVAKCKTDMTSCVEEAATLQAEVDRLQSAILDAGGPKLKKQQETCEKILKSLNDAQKQLNTARVAVVSSEKAVAKASAAKAAAELKLEETQAKLDEKKAERDSLEKDAEGVLSQYEAVMALEQEQREELESIHKEIEDLRKSLADAKSIELEYYAKIEDRNKQALECEKRLKHWEKCLESLRAAAQEDEEEDDDEDLHGDDNGQSPADLGQSGTEDAMEIDAEGDDQEGNDANGPTGGSNDDENSDLEMQDAGADADQPLVSKPLSALPTFTFDALEKYSKRNIKEEIEILTSEKNSMAKNANMGAIAEYKKKEADYLSR